MTIGERIKQARKAKGFTQKQLGELSNTSEGTVRQYEIGKRQPRLEQLQRIALALGTTVSELVEPGYWSTVSKEEVEESWGDATAIKATSVSARERVKTALDKLNDAGMEKAADMVEIIAEVPHYKVTGGSQQPSPRPRFHSGGGGDTTPPEAPEMPSAGE